MHVSCPECGTSYALKREVLERPRTRLRCRRCSHVWDPRHPFGPVPAAEPLASTTATVAALDSGVDERDEGRRGGADQPTSRFEAEATSPFKPPWRAALAASVLIICLGGVAGAGYAYRDHLPGFGKSQPEFSEVEPTWRDVAGERQLVLSATLSNPGRRTAEIDEVRVKFLSERGAWIGERVIAIPHVLVEPDAMSTVEMAVDSLPDGTASLELSVVANEPTS